MAPSLNEGSLNRLVVAIGTLSPVSARAFLKSLMIVARSEGVASMGTRSSSWKLTP